MYGQPAFTAIASGSGAPAGAESAHSTQSAPKSSAGCGVRMVPFPHARSPAGQYLSQPQQIRSGREGCSEMRFMEDSASSVSRTAEARYDGCHTAASSLTS